MTPAEVDAEMLRLSKSYFCRLVDVEGIPADIAADRVWDCYERAYERTGGHCAESRDRLFENRLRTLREKG